MSIYTKKGDRGETKLFSSSKPLPKNSLIFACLGAIDELNSYLGVVTAHSEDQALNTFLFSIQKNLFTINSILAGARLRFPKTKTNALEKKIDEIEAFTPPLKNFILPGGSQTAAHLQYARTICRRAERHVISFNQKNHVKPEIIRYLNRLSDCLFTLARASNHQLNISDKPWKIS